MPLILLDGFFFIANVLLHLNVTKLDYCVTCYENIKKPENTKWS